MADITALMDFVNELNDEHTVALFEVLVDIDPLAMEDGKPKYTRDQQTVIADAKAAYVAAGYTTD